jgi:hypothetical protein
MKCPFCKEEIAGESEVCQLCNSEIIRRCPLCLEKIHLEALKCKHCGSMLNNIAGAHTEDSGRVGQQPPVPSPQAAPSNMTQKQSDRFIPEDDERIFFEGVATYIKSKMNVVNGYAFITSKRFVFSGSDRLITKSVLQSDTAYDDKILFSFQLEDIVNIQDGKYGLSKKYSISTKTGNEYSVQLNEKWIEFLKNPSLALSVLSAQNESENLLDDGSQWYYEESGNKIGPLSSLKMKQLAHNNHTVYRFTKVWREGMLEWKKAEETELIQFFAGPPPLVVSNVIMWILAVSPLIGDILGSILQESFKSPEPRLLFMVIAGPSFLLSYFDSVKLASAGHNLRALGLGSAWIVPVYMYNRARAFKQSLAYFIVWMVLTLLIIIGWLI